MRGDRMRKIREEVGYTQEQLAELIGVAVLQINRYENGKNEPSGDMVAKIATVLHVSTDYLLGLTDNPAPLEFAGNLSSRERFAIAAWRRGEYREAIKVIVADE